jgi:DNA-binding PadR family transcriptional regulator
MTIRHTLLGLLDHTPLHGYALRELANGFAWLHPMTNANLYPALRELEEQGLIRHSEQIQNGRLRKVYAITDLGREELRRWLHESKADPIVYRDPVLLRVCMLRDEVLGKAPPWLDHDLRRCAESIDVCERYLEGAPARGAAGTRRVVEYWLALSRLRLEFLRGLLDET